VPIAPPAAGPDRALNPPLPPRPNAAGAAAPAAAAVPLDVARRIPYVPPAIAAAARPAATKAAGLLDDIAVLLLIVCLHDADTD
jgi:hypothetical protein